MAKRRSESPRPPVSPSARVPEDRRFRALIEHSWDAIVLLDADGVIQYASPSTLHVLGYSPDELIGVDASSLIHPQDKARALTRFKQLVRQPGTTTTVEYRSRHKDGSWRWIEGTGSNQLNDPEVNGVVSNFRDITERKQAVAGMRSMTAGARCILWHADVRDTGREYLHWDLRVWDEEAAQRFLPIEIPPGLTYVQAWYESRLPEDKLEMGSHATAEVRANRGYRQEFRCRRKDGEIRWLAEEVQIEPLTPGHWRAVGVCMDITERKSAEQALREREEEERHFSAQLTLLQEITNQLSRTSSLDDLCRLAVERGHDLLGFERLGLWFAGPDRASAVGTFGVDEHGQIRDERGSCVKVSPNSLAGQVLMSGRPFALREDAPVMDHHADPVGRGMHAIAGLWNGEEVIGFLSTDNLLSGRPLTDRHCRLLTLYASALGHLVALKRLEDELRSRAAALMDADRRKDEFLAMLAHELRNPLSPILNSVQLMRLPGARDDHLQRAQDVVERQVQHMARLINDLLDVSRITQGKIELRKEKIDVAEVVRQAVESVQPQIESRRHQLSVSIPLEPVRLEADPTRLEQILSNLLNNATKYTEWGGRIWLSVERLGDQVELRVRDTGVGIASELLPHVFDLFTQADRSLDRSQGGLGIGLTMVQRLVQMHGGSVEAHSPGPGQGSEFVVRLPALPAPARTCDPAPLRSPGSPSRPLRILVVDDNPDAAETLAELLQLDGHEVSIAHDGYAALDLAARTHPELVLLDIGLPGMDGHEVARRLREQLLPPEARIVALSGYGPEQDSVTLSAASFDHHLVKPVDYTALQSLLFTPR